MISMYNLFTDPNIIQYGAFLRNLTSCLLVPWLTRFSHSDGFPAAQDMEILINLVTLEIVTLKILIPRAHSKFPET